jgi:hypothetical protein
MQCKPPADAFDVSFAAACDAMQGKTRRDVTGMEWTLQKQTTDACNVQYRYSNVFQSIAMKTESREGEREEII